MGKKKLAIVKYYHQDSHLGRKDTVAIVFNRQLHPLEAMGIVAVIERDMHRALD